MMYLILAIICLTVGTPNWTVALCFFCFGVCVYKSFFMTDKGKRVVKVFDEKPYKD